MYIEVLGYARVKWKRKKPEDTQQRTFSGEQMHLSSKTSLVNNSEDIMPSLLHPGIHTYSFEKTLPEDLPSSFTGKHGHVRYEVIISTEEQNGEIEKFDQPFTVIKTLDLNSDKSFAKPIQGEEVKEITFCFCFHERLKAKCSLPFSGYVPGQKIPLTLHVDNDTNYHCFGSRVKLVKIVTYNSKHPYERTISETFKIADQKFDRIESYSSQDYDTNLLIPPLPPSSDDKHSIIDVKYEVSFFVHGATNRSIEVRIPITVGTVPLLESGQNRQTVRSEIVPPTAGTNESPIIPANHTCLPSAPPSYEEAMAFPTEPSPYENEIEFIAADDYSYLPRYAVYSNYPLPSLPHLGEVGLGENLRAKELPSNSGKNKGVKYGWKL